MPQPAGLLFSKDHEWVKIDGDVATVGITDYAQTSLGDIVYVELPRIGATLQQFGNIGVVESVKAVSDILTPVGGAPVQQFGNIGVVESVKAVSDLFTPVGGEVLEINEAIDSDPSLVNRAPFDEGWLFKVKLADHGESSNLISGEAYDALIAESA